MDAAHPIQRIISVVAAKRGVAALDIVSARRTKAITRPRQEVCWLGARKTPYSLPEIGRQLGGRDHTTVLYSRDKVDALRLASPAYAAELDGLAAMVRAALKAAPEPDLPRTISEREALKAELLRELRPGIRLMVQAELITVQGEIAEGLAATLGAAASEARFRHLSGEVARRASRLAAARETRFERPARDRLDEACNALMQAAIAAGMPMNEKASH